MSAKFIQIIGKEIMAGGEANNVFTKCFLFALNMAYCEKNQDMWRSAIPSSCLKIMEGDLKQQLLKSFCSESFWQIRKDQPVSLLTLPTPTTLPFQGQVETGYTDPKNKIRKDIGQGS